MNEVSILNIDRFPLSAFNSCTGISSLVLKGGFYDFYDVTSFSYPLLEVLELKQCSFSSAGTSISDQWLPTCAISPFHIVFTPRDSASVHELSS